MSAPPFDRFEEFHLMPLRSPRSQRTLMALAGTGALMGYLLASGAVAPVVSDVVALVSPAKPAVEAPAHGTTLNGKRVALSDSNTENFSSDDTWMDDEKRSEWSPSRLVPQGPTGSSAAQKPDQPVTPLIQVPENPKGRNLFNQPEPMRRYELKGPGACAQAHGKGLYVQHFGAVPTKGGATVSWWDLGDPNTTEYQVDAVETTGNGSVTTRTIAPPKACKDVSLTFTGLNSGSSYFFTLTATNTSPEQENREYRVGRGESTTIVVQ